MANEAKGSIAKGVDAPIKLKELYRALILPRTIEEKMLRLIRQSRLSKWFSGFGQEAIAVGCASALRDDDFLLPMHRNLGIWTTRKVPLERLFCQLMGRTGGFTNGRDRTFHFGLPDKHIVGMISHLAAMLPVACGLGLSAKLDGSDQVALALVGEGSTREGDFHEALNLAAVWKLPVIFVIENNKYGLSTPTSEAFIGKSFAAAAAGYGMPGKRVDGNDILAVINAVREAATLARSGEGPTLLEMKTFRMRGHEEASGTKYVPKTLMEEWAKKDPVTRFERRLMREGIYKREELDAIKEKTRVSVEEIAEFVLKQPFVQSTLEREKADVFAPATVPSINGNAKTEKIRFIDAIKQSLFQAMQDNDRTLILGQDIAEYGGVFKVTEGFLEAFGRDRVRNTPIIESGAIGASLGLALNGHVPIIEIQYADFISCGFNQIVNNLATTHYRWGAKVPVTIRAPFGGHIGAGPFHSQSLEAWFCHVPGLKVVVPATPHDAKGLLQAAINDPNPVLFLEHKKLYRSLKGEVPVNRYEIPLGMAKVVAEGADLTIVTYGIGVQWALEQVEAFGSKGVSIEVVDLRTLVPWDKQTVLESVRKTNRVIVLHEAAMTGGFGAELAATVAQEAFDYLDAPPVRVAAEDLPVPFSESLEKDIYSPLPRLVPAIEKLLAF